MPLRDRASFRRVVNCFVYSQPGLAAKGAGKRCRKTPRRLYDGRQGGEGASCALPPFSRGLRERHALFHPASSTRFRDPRADFGRDRPRVTWDRKKTNTSRGDYWPAALPWREIPELPLRGSQGALPLLRMRRFGRSLPLPDGDRGAALSRSRAADRRYGGRGMPRRQAGGGAREAAHPRCST